MLRIGLLLLLSTAALAQEYGETYRLKVDVSGQRRTVALFVPKSTKSGGRYPLLVALPAKDKAFGEVGQWQQPAYDKKFCVLSVDITTSSVRKPWHPSDALDMLRDCEAFDAAFIKAGEKMKELGMAFDPSAIVLTGHSGSGYAMMHLGLRRPDVFLAICGRSIVFYKEIAKFGKLEKAKPNYNVQIFLYRGELDSVRVKKTTDDAVETLKAAGWKNVRLLVVPKMQHESKPEVLLEWFEKLLKETAKGRKEATKIAGELAKLEKDLDANKPGSLGKLAKLAAREKKAGFKAGAIARLAVYEKKAKEDWDRAENLAADNDFDSAIALFKKIEKSYKGLELSKKAKKRRGKIVKSDDYVALGMLQKAQKFREQGKDDKANALLEKIIAKYPKTLAADRAKNMMD